MRVARRPNRLSLWLLIGLAVWLGMVSATHGVAAATSQSVCTAAGGVQHGPSSDDSWVHRPLEAFHDCPLCATAWGPLTESNRGLALLPAGRFTQTRIGQGDVLVRQSVTPPSRAPPPLRA